jgi:hypothetical protein
MNAPALQERNRAELLCRWRQDLQPQSTAFPHVNSKAVIRRMQSGNLLVIRHGQDITKTTPKRQELTSFLLFPGRHLHGVHVELLDILLHRLEPFEGFQSHAGS